MTRIQGPFRGAAPTFAAAFALAGVLLAAGGVPAAGALTISGHVLRGQAREPAAGIPVSLHVVRGDEELPGKNATSDRSGAFRFIGVASDAGLSYFVSTEYEGAFYTEGPIDVSGKGEATKDLVVYDVGRDIDAVRVTNHHIIVERNPDHLHVTEILMVENRGATAYLGTGMDHSSNAGIRLGLPASVEDFRSGMGGDEQSVRVQGRDLSSARPVPPGNNHFTFTYHIPLSGRMDLSHRLYFPTDQFVVLLSDPSLKLETSSLEYKGPRDQGDKKFEVYQGSNFPVGSEVTMRIGGAGFWSNPAVYPWLAAPFLIAAVLVYASRRGRRTAAAPGTHLAPTLAAVPGPGAAPRPAPAPAASPSSKGHPAPAAPGPAGAPADDEFASVYLYLIDALDRGVERGEIPRDAYALVRANLKRRLEAIVSDVSRAGGDR
jgi:hypothetical protein